MIIHRFLSHMLVVINLELSHGTEDRQGHAMGYRSTGPMSAK